MNAPSPSPGDEMRREHLVVALAGVVTAALFARTLAWGFVWDDRTLVLLNPWLDSPSELAQAFTHDFFAFMRGQSVTNAYYRPLVHVVLAALKAAFGAKAWAFHGALIALHVSATLVVGRLALAWSTGPNRLAAAATSAFVFATHPMHVEAVAWVSSLADAGASLCVLATLLLVVRDEDVPSWPRLVALGVLVLAGCWFKEIGVVGAGAALTWTLVVSPQPSATRRRHAAAVALGLGVYLLSRAGVMAGHGATSRLASLSGADLWLTGLNLLGASVQLVVAPLEPSAWRSLVVVRSPLEGSTPLALLAVVTSLALLAFAVKARNRRLTMLVLVLGASLLPGTLVHKLGPNALAERYLYLPSAAWCVGLGYAASHLAARFTRPLLLVTGLVAVLGAAATWQRLPVWRDNVSLFSDIERTSPEAPVIAQNLGHAWLMRGDASKALSYLTRADDGPGDYWADRGVANAQLGELVEAERCFLQALKQEPNASALANLCRLERLTNRLTEAEAHCRAALAVTSRDASLHEVYAALLVKLERLDEARAEALRALELDPTSAAAKRILERVR